MRKLSVKEFAQKVGERPGNVQFFRKCLRKKKRLADREKLDESFIVLFIKVVERRSSKKETWDQAMNEVI
ncbi:hypothetical protein HGO21_03550 [Acinetobacter sp. CUI P1]|nr:hypothetical protein [Acinetobacter sp. CUI P1]